MVYALIGITLLFSLWPIVWVWRAKSKTRLEGFTRMLAAATAIWFVNAAGAWGFISVYLRSLFLVVFAVALIRALRRLRFLPKAPQNGWHGWKTIVISTAVMLLFFALNMVVYRGRAYSKDAVDLSFPLKNGTYYVLQGGSSIFGRYFHQSQDDERYELDIVRLNAQGNRASGIVPDSLGDYAIFGDTVYCPCTGIVFDAQGTLPDEPPSHNNPVHSPGNYVTMDCGQVEVQLGHLKRNSLLVGAGSLVAKGEPMALVGNSGSSIEPHLHISARRMGEPVAMRFDGKHLSLNSIIRTRKE